MRRAIAISGTVQGVGFRPFVYGLACRLRLNGFVRNETAGVSIEIEGEPSRLDQFLGLLMSQLPPLAQIEQIAWEARPLRGDTQFRIEPSSRESEGPVVIAPDVAVCGACLQEMTDPDDRRYLYPFLNCTDCGPRLTIVTGAPYDRERTTMAGFTMCADCRAEYENPIDRRFHAQPVACPVCGPRLRAHDAEGMRLAVADPLRWFAQAMLEGRIGGLKGLGGYHLACDARNMQAVCELRRRKGREEKPFAVMVADLTAAEALCEMEAAERQLLTSASRPIVLMCKRAGTAVAAAVAPHNPLLGLMLPYTPLHHLLMKAVDGIPLVMTSANRSEEPIAFHEPAAFEQLRAIADVFLSHNRPINLRCDDSVTRIIAGAESPVRRSRGYAPRPITLPCECPEPLLAVGGQLKVTFALGRGYHAVVSHHIGNLDHYAAYRAFESEITLYERLFAVRPKWIAHDLHPDYASTRYALKRQGEGLRTIAVQHHHAHMASCMAEHRLRGPVIGVTFDGIGFGADGTLWGGEFLAGDYRQFRRLAHLRAVAMPGAEQAIREPWRMGLAYLADAALDCPSLRQKLEPVAVRTVARMLERRFNSPLTSSAGRLFDAVAALAGVRERVSFEGQAAMELEALAATVPGAPGYGFEIVKPAPGEDESLVIDTRPLVREVCEDIAAGSGAAMVARRFHCGLAAMIAAVCRRLRQQTAINEVVLSGGVFMNALLSAEAETLLRAAGFSVYRHQRVPPNDGGLSLGQIAIAAHSQTAEGVVTDALW